MYAAVQFPASALPTVEAAKNAPKTPDNFLVTVGAWFG
jgi:hypothetical protein